MKSSKIAKVAISIVAATGLALATVAPASAYTDPAPKAPTKNKASVSFPTKKIKKTSVKIKGKITKGTKAKKVKKLTIKVTGPKGFKTVKKTVKVNSKGAFSFTIKKMKKKGKYTVVIKSATKGAKLTTIKKVIKK